MSGIGALLVLMLIVDGLIGACAGWAAGRAYGRAEGASWQRWQALRRPPVTADVSVKAPRGHASGTPIGHAYGRAGPGCGPVHAEVIVLTQSPSPPEPEPHSRVVPGVVERERKELEP